MPWRTLAAMRMCRTFLECETHSCRPLLCRSTLVLPVQITARSIAEGKERFQRMNQNAKSSKICQVRRTSVNRQTFLRITCSNSGRKARHIAVHSGRPCKHCHIKQDHQTVGVEKKSHLLPNIHTGHEAFDKLIMTVDQGVHHIERLPPLSPTGDGPERDDKQTPHDEESSRPRLAEASGCICYLHRGIVNPDSSVAHER